MTPILTNRARKQTPKVGSNALRASLPRTQPALFEHTGIKSVVVTQIEDSDVLNLEEVLCVIFFALRLPLTKMEQECSPHNRYYYSYLHPFAI
jgi:hypothetical protein